ncbi:AAA family ATPase [uncultured Pseudomonas sp.]|uniref:AAA family ATPase n=1 Tax=uncultured Pseudomonas sp. TaxID=114707 RepID=UPI002587E4A6|nr:AAA family ATPase [uncultured Pseudomonas sp.]
MSGMQFYFSNSFDFEKIDGVHLLQDHVGTYYSKAWDDFGYIVTFQVYFVKGGNRESLGRTKVLVNGYTDSSSYFSTSSVRVGNSIRITALLDHKRVVSLASDIDYYRRIHALIPHKAEDYLRQICDGSYNLHAYGEFSNWEGFELSLFRDRLAKAILKKGYQIALGSYEAQEKFSFELEGLPDSFDSVEFNFDNARQLGRTNINLLIGRNGAGKSHVLRHLIDLVAGVKKHAESWPFFHKVVVVAYSPFESFKTEAELSNALANQVNTARANDNNGEGELTAKEEQERRRRLVNEYVYIGFRDPEGKFSLVWPKESSARALHRIVKYDAENEWVKASRFELLFDTLSHSIDFDAVRVFKKEKSSPDSAIILNRATNTERLKLAEEQDFDYAAGIEFLKEGNVISLSSGQTIYSYLLPNLVAEVDEESLLILDEPELYLHPAMEIGLLDMLKQLLAATRSNAIIATHSTILAREVERSAISVLRKVDGRTEVSKPSFETFGQTVEVIMGLAFDDYQARKPYEDSIDKAVAGCASPKEALEKLGPKVGDEALAYLSGKVISDGDDVEPQIQRRPE